MPTDLRFAARFAFAPSRARGLGGSLRAMGNLLPSYPWALRVERFEDRAYGSTQRSEWPEGPWTTEPDFLEWRSSLAPHYPLMLIRGPLGAWCGYVGVPPHHPSHGREGIRGFNWFGPSRGLRVPTSEPPHFWWLGFDCAHVHCQYAPAYVAILRSSRVGPDQYVTLEQCRAMTESLAIAQLPVAPRD